jgi:RNA-directed DNA polymerase
MRRAGHLFERVVGFGHLCRSARRAARGKEITDEAARFLIDLEIEALALQRELLDGSYAPGRFRTFEISDPKPRTISAAPFCDRVVHHALCAVLEPVFERYAIHDSYACRTGKGSLSAIQRAQQLSRRHAWFLKLDIRHYFETLDHEILFQLMARLVKDRRVLDLTARILSARAAGQPDGKGLPIGNLTSQHFANLYLGTFDHHAKEALRARGYLRYMDDMILFGPDRATMRRWRDEATSFLEGPLRLEVKEEATRIGPVAEGVPYLGFRIWPRQIRFDGARARRFRRRVRWMEAAQARGEIGDREREESVRSLVAWSETGDTLRFRRSFFEGLAR